VPLLLLLLLLLLLTKRLAWQLVQKLSQLSQCNFTFIDYHLATGHL